MASIVQHPSLKSHSQSKQIREAPVEQSSFIQFLKYDPDTLQLTVTMKNGAEYIHWYVYPAVADDLFESPSKGKFYSEAIKGRHPSTVVISKNIGKKASTKGQTNGKRD